MYICMYIYICIYIYIYIQPLILGPPGGAAASSGHQKPAQTRRR